MQTSNDARIDRMRTTCMKAYRRMAEDMGLNVERTGLGVGIKAGEKPGDPDIAHFKRETLATEVSAPQSHTLHIMQPLDDPGDVTMQTMKAMGRFLKQIEALIRREGDILRFGHDLEKPPAWAFVIHPLMRRLLEDDGIDPLLSGKANGGKLNLRGRPTAVTGIVPAGADGMLYQGLAYRAHARVTRLWNPVDDRKKPFDMIDGERTAIRLLDTTLPETALLRIPGMPLKDVIDCVPFRDCELKATGARNSISQSNPHCIIDIERVHEPLAPAPAGIAEAGWLRIL